MTKLNKLIILFIVLFLSVGAVSAAHDIDNNMTVDNFSISETDGAVLDNQETLSANIESDNSDVGSHVGDLPASVVNEDYANGSSDSKTNLLGSTDEEDNERFSGEVWYVDCDATQEELDSNSHLFRNIRDAIDSIYNEYGDQYECSGQILIKSGTYTGDDNIGLNFYTWNLLIKAADGPVVITGQSDHIYEVGNWGVYFKGITFSNINVESSVIATYGDDWTRYVHFENCDFINITARSNGGIIHIKDEGAIIENCNFINITSDSDGGAIYIEGNNVEITNSHFINVASGSNGGAIYINAEDAQIHDCEFINNSADRNGGAIYANAASTIRGNTFIGNIAVDGGAIYKNVDSVTDEDNEFEGNIDTHSEESTIWYVDCDATSEELESDDHLFNNIQDAVNSILDKYGWNDEDPVELKIKIKSGYYTGENNIGLEIPIWGLSIEAVDGPVIISGTADHIFEANYYDIHFKGITFSNIQVDSSAIIATEWSEGLHFEDCDFINITSGSEGGAIYISEASLIENCNFINITSGSEGGAIYISKSSLIDNCTFINVTSSSNGGAIYIENSYNVEIANSHFINVTSDCDGGAIYANEHYAQIHDCEFINDSAVNGGAIYAYELTEIIGNSFTGNTATNNGGAICFNKGDNTVDGCDFTNNTASNNGGAIYIPRYYDNTVINSDFTGNSAKNGGSIYDSGYHSKIAENTFDKSSASSKGGSIYIEQTISEFYNNTISNSNAENGKSIYNDGTFDTVTVILADNTTFAAEEGVGAKVSVKVTDDMGNIIAGRTVRIYADGTQLMDVIAGDNLEIIVNPIHEGEVTISAQYLRASNTISKNAVIIFPAPYLGPIYVSTNGSNENDGSEDRPVRTIEKALSLATRANNTHSIFINEGTYYENTLVVPQGVGVNITGLGSVTINGNQSKILNVYQSFTNISNINFVNGTSDYASVFIRGNNISIENCTFKENTGKTYGALYIEGSNVTVSESTFTDNTGVSGGALYINGKNATVDGCTFTGNTAVNGGALYMSTYDDTSSVSDCIFTGNSASEFGGSIYNKGNNLTLAHNTISSSNAPEGKKIYNGGSLKNHVLRVLDNSTVTCYDHQSVTVTVNVTDDMGNEISGNYITLFLNGEKLISNILVSEGLATASVNPPRGISTVSASYPESGKVYTGKIEYNGNPYTGRIYVAPWGNDDNDGSFYYTVKSLEKAIELATASNNQVHEVWMRYGDYEVTDFVISHPVSIMGYDDNEDVIINGHNKAIFEIAADNVTISNVKFINSTADAVTINANNAHISNAIFDDAAVQTARYADVHNTTIEDCSFSNTESSRYYGDGLTIKDCNFTNVSSNDNGGALVITATNSLVDNCIFTDCESSANGGAIYGTKENITIANSKFSDTHARSSGALDLSSKNAVIKNCTFEDISASSGRGAIRLSGADGLIEDCTFTNITTPTTGAVHVSGANPTIANSTFNDVSSTRSTVYSGAIYLEDSRNGGTIYNCTFNNVQSDYRAGAINVEREDVAISKCTFNNVQSTTQGGAIRSIERNTTISDCSFNNTHCDDNGGAIYLLGKDSSVNGCSFTDTTSDKSGGAIYVNGEDSVIDNCDFTATNADNGGAIYVNEKNAHINNCDFTATTSDGDGGAIYIHASDSSIDNCSFDGTEGVDGGAIYIDGESASVDNSNFTNTHSTSSGGAIYLSSDSDSINNCSFTNTRADDKGGAIQISGDNSIISDCSFDETHANSDGGAIHITGDNPTISGSSFTDTYANSNGGAVFTEGSDTNVSGCTFTGTQSGNDGGAIYTNGQDTTVSGCAFNSTQSGNDGGAIYTNGQDTTVSGCAFNSTQSGNDGGAVYSEAQGTDVSDSTFTGTQSGNDGGAIFVHGEDAGINNCSFESTYSGHQGGAVYINGNQSNIEDCRFSDVSANDYGGGIRLYESSDSNISNCNFTNTNAFSGAALAARGNNLNIENITSEHSTSKEWGAVVVDGLSVVSEDGTFAYLKYSHNATLNNIKVSDSACEELGGGIYVNGHNCVLNNSMVTNSKAYMGGGIYWNGNNGTIENTDVSNNEAKVGAGIFWMGENGTLKNSNVTYNVASQYFGGVAYSSEITQENNDIHDNYPKGSDLEDYSKVPYALSTAEYESYFIKMSDGSTGFCLNPFRMRADTSDIFLVYEAEPVRKSRAVTSDVLPIIRNVNDRSDVSEYLKILFYEYEATVGESTLKSAYQIFLQGKYQTSTNTLVKSVLSKYNQGLRIANTGAKKIVTNSTGQKVIRQYNFSSLINTQSLNQNLMTYKYTDTPLNSNFTVEKITLTPDVPVGNQTKFLIRVTNNGNWVTGNITVSEVTYTGLKYCTYVDSDNRWTFIGSQDNPKWKYEGSLEIDESVEFTVIFNTTEPGNFTNIVTASNENTTHTVNNTTEVHNFGIKVEKISLTPDVPVGSQTSFIIRVTNTGDWELVNVNVTEVEYDGLTYHGFVDSTDKWEFQDSSDKPMWIYNDVLPIGESAEFTVIFNTTEPGNFTNIVTAGNNKTSDKGNNTTEVHNFGIKVEKISLTPDVPVGDQTSFIIRVTNTGDWELVNVNVTEVEYDGLTYHGFVDSTDKWEFQDSSDKPMWIYNDVLPIGESAEFTVIFNTTEPGNFTNIVTAGNNKTTDKGNNTTEVHKYGIKVEKISLTPDVPVGSQTSFIIRVTNTGDWELVDVNVTEVEYDGLTYDGFVDSTEKWEFQDSSDKPMWIYNDVLPIGESAEFTVIFNTTKAGNFTNIVTAGNNKTSDKGNNTTEVHSFGMKVEKVSLTPMVEVGEPAFFVISVTNTGDWPLSKFNVTEINSEGLMYNDFIADDNWSFIGTMEHPVWEYNGILPINKTVNITVIYTTLKAGNFTNVVSVGNNQTSAQSQDNIVLYRYNLTVVKNTLTPKVHIGELTSFLIRVNNTGDRPLKQVYVVEIAYDGLVYDHYTDKSGKWIFDGKNKWTYNDDLDEGAVADFTVFFKAVKVGNLTNIIIAGSNSTNETTTNDTVDVLEKNNTNNTKKTPDKKGKHDKDSNKKDKTDKKSNKNSDESKHSGYAKFVGNNTGNPIVVLLMSVLMLFVSIRYRKK